MAGIGLNTALLGLFSSDKKQAKAREMQIAQQMYSKEQAELKQQYELDASLRDQQLAYDKNAKIITTKREEVAKLQNNLDDLYDQVREGAKKYGNAQKYMLAEGNDLLYKGRAKYEQEIDRIKLNQDNISKFMEASDDSPLLMHNDEIKRYNDYLNGKSDTYTFKGLLTEIDDGYITEGQKGVNIQPTDILDHGQNKRAITQNYIREHDGQQPTEIDLINYTREKYIGDGQVTGTAEIKTSFGNEIAKLSELTLNLVAPPQKAFTESFDETFKNVGDQAMQFGYDPSKRASMKNGKRINTGGMMFTQSPDLQDAIGYATFNGRKNGTFYNPNPKLALKTENGIPVTSSDLEEERFNNVFNIDTTTLHDEDGNMITDSDTGWEIFGNESKTIDARLNGYFYGTQITYLDENTGELKTSLITENTDPEKAAELEQNFRNAQSRKTVLLAELQEKDALRDDFYYKVIDMNPNMQTAVNEYMDNDELSAVMNQNADAKKMIESKKANAEQMLQAENGIMEYTGDNNGTVMIYNTLGPEVMKSMNYHGVDNNMFGNIMAFNMLRIPEGTEKPGAVLQQNIRNMYTELGQESDFSKAIKGGSATFNSYLRKSGIFADSELYEKYRLLSGNWNAYAKNKK
jgi:hypothetical protein